MQEERLAELLERYHSGESNAATSRELECVFSIKGIEVRQMVNRLRRKGIPIASSGSGYFYAATEQEVRATIAHLTRRISGIAAAMLPHGPALKSTAPPHQHQSAKLPSPWLPFFPLVLPFSMFWRL